MESDETPEEAVARELFEETQAKLNTESLRLYLVGSIPDISEVYLVYRAKLLSPEFGPSKEAEDVALFTEVEMSKLELAYPEVDDFLYSYHQERKSGDFGVYTGSYKAGAFTMSKITE